MQSHFLGGKIFRMR